MATAAAGNPMIDIEKAEKLPRERRYFNISVIWIFYYHSVLRLLYRLHVPHDLVTAAAIGCGLASAYCFFDGRLIVAAILLHLKDVFDACDGSLARLTGKGHLIGRYVDSLGDFLVLVSVVGAISLRAYYHGEPQYLFWGLLAAVSIFIQCSVFNFYQLAYVEQFQIGSLSSRRDETDRDDLHLPGRSFVARYALKFLHFLYIIVYSWQDKLVAAADNRLLKRCFACSRDRWYGEKSLMTLQSPLCFGTHIFVLILGALLGRPEYSLVFVAVAMNIYLLILLYYRRSYFLRAVLKEKRVGEVLRQQ
jgi:phosphatidylglycerophosphate synthase